MKADFSRNTFDPRKHYAAVLEQQGRVQLDADRNEQHQIDAHRSASVARDVIGLSGAPNAGGGFGLRFTADGTDLAITPGRFYVDGLLCENDADDAFVFTSNGDTNATLPIPRPELAPFAPGQWVVLSAAAGTQQQLRITSVSPTDTGVVLGLSGAIQRPPPPAAPATGPFTGTLQRTATYLTQPDFPNPDHAGTSTTGAAILSLANGLYVTYLDVWERHVSALDDPAIRETALGGPDTAARAKTVWQLKLLQVTPPSGSAAACGTAFPEWDALAGVGSGSLAARAAPSQGQAGPCLIPPGGGYQGLENQLYRIEIHDSGADGTATFKWSRDNGSVVTPVQSFNGSTLTVASTGPDDALGLANGQWVEILGDFEELHGVPGQMIQIATVDPAKSTVNFASPPRPIATNLHPKMRRWDGATGLVAIPAGGSGWIDLEAGVQVALTPGQFACGDYWLVPARAGAAATVEWNHATPQPPQGVHHHLARIGLLNWTGTAANSTLNDCRPAFAPLTDIPPALHITSISWQNDDVVSLAQFAAGLSVTLDGAPIAQYSVTLQNTPTLLSLMTANDSSMVVTIEMPIAVPNQPAGANPPPTMPATVVLSGSPISWNPATNSLTWMPSAAATTIVNSATGGQARVRVRLKGDFVWGDQGQQRLYLDGATRGRPGLSTSRPNTLRTDLALPSGLGRRSSDFDSWFLLQFADTPVSLGSFFIAPGTIIGGGAPVAQVQLASVAKAAVNVALTVTSQPQIAVTVASPAVVPIGQSNVNVPVTINAPASSSLVTVTATVPPVPNSPLTTTLSASVLVVVVSVGVSPPSALLLVGATQRFSATVSGVGLALPDGISTAVNWSCSGGAIDRTGTYTAPGVAGSFTVTATSVADPTRSAQAVVTVRTKGKDKDKDAKETKETKEVREKVSDVVTKVSDVISKVSDVTPKTRDVILQPLAPRSVAAPPATRSAFITPEERPQVGAAPAAKADQPVAPDDAPAASEKKPAAKAAAKPSSKPRKKK
ncbi:DUF6519 domain-containing protein [Variovorax humicola]|uniref:DUF6519 domain-containing protein n=1 Tax=Variovorax humicola TaxID=1769758 RepID=A0ABU8VWY5_9BURK